MGFEGILSNGYYVDLNQPAAWHYASDPVPPDSTLSEEAKKRVLGGEATMWSEFTTPEVVDSRIWPRTAAIAERLWSPASVRDVEDMYRRLQVQGGRLDRLGMQHVSGYEPMLARLTDGQPTGPLKVLVDVVEPVKEYRRGQLGTYRTFTPLDRIADAARPESEPARVFRRDVDRFLLSPAGRRDDASLRARLTAWRDNHAALDPIAAASSRLFEARWLSKDLSAIAALGLQALDAIGADRQTLPTWSADAKETLDAAARPRAAVEIQVLPGIRKLVLAAASLDAAKTLSPEEWMKRLEEQMKPAARRGEGH
jgi:hexosaminidase